MASWGGLAACSNHGARTEPGLTESPRPRMPSLLGLLAQLQQQCCWWWECTVGMHGAFKQHCCGKDLSYSWVPAATNRHGREPGEVTCAVVTSIQLVLPLLWPTWASCSLVSTRSTDHRHIWATRVASWASQEDAWHTVPPLAWSVQRGLERVRRAGQSRWVKGGRCSRFQHPDLPSVQTLKSIGIRDVQGEPH